MPPAKTCSEEDVSASVIQANNILKENCITREYMDQYEDPALQGAETAQDELKEHAEQGPAAFREEEASALEGARGEASSQGQSGVAALFDERTKNFAGVGEKQERAKSDNEQKRDEAARAVEQIFTDTKAKVDARLTKIDTDALATFDRGSSAAVARYEQDAKRRLEAYKKERYSGRPDLWVRDLFLPLPPEVSAIYLAARDAFVADRRVVNGEVADVVGTGPERGSCAEVVGSDVRKMVFFLERLALLGVRRRLGVPLRGRSRGLVQLSVPWVIRDDFPVQVVERGRAGRLILMSGFSENLRVLHGLRPGDVIFSLTVGDYQPPTFEAMRKAAHLWAIDVGQLVVFCNTAEQVRWAHDAGIRAVLCNHNAFIDERLFAPRGRPKLYDAVYNTRPDKIKRVGLARLVERLALVRGYAIQGVDFEDISAVPHAYLNERPLSPHAVVDVLSASRVGLILSEAEGACLASSEYLLCGLPVVSTPSRGGRDVWYTADNSILCDPRPEAVRDAVSAALLRLELGEMRPDVIRNAHIAQARGYRAAFVEEFHRALERISVYEVNPEKLGKYLCAVGVFPRYAPYAQVCRELAS